MYFCVCNFTDEEKAKLSNLPFTHDHAASDSPPYSQPQNVFNCASSGLHDMEVML